MADSFGLPTDKSRLPVLIDKYASEGPPKKFYTHVPNDDHNLSKDFREITCNNSPMLSPEQHRDSRVKLVPEQEPFETVAYVGLKNLVYPHPRNGSSGSRLQITPSLAIRNPNSSSPRPQRYSDIPLLGLLYPWQTLSARKSHHSTTLLSQTSQPGSTPQTTNPTPAPKPGNSPKTTPYPSSTPRVQLASPSR
jgi:hypothetical protein